MLDLGVVGTGRVEVIYPCKRLKLLHQQVYPDPSPSLLVIETGKAVRSNQADSPHGHLSCSLTKLDTVGLRATIPSPALLREGRTDLESSRPIPFMLET